ncbi:MAG TPA: hypothetical protein VK186_07125 [Candidatus Deferrimicrobium sp.]|nr:hypothetical protein [Candidatus Kapabacteria bacterium]HLP58581.1 hypothetical protein [Candidatus Deferrimicrobium sp.]
MKKNNYREIRKEEKVGGDKKGTKKKVKKRKARDGLNGREGLSHRITYYPSRAFFINS